MKQTRERSMKKNNKRNNINKIIRNNDRNNINKLIINNARNNISKLIRNINILILRKFFCYSARSYVRIFKSSGRRFWGFRTKVRVKTKKKNN